MTNQFGREISAGPITAFVKLSGSTASAPAIIVTATIVGSAQTIHTSDANAQDVLYIYAYNPTAASQTVYFQAGTTATTSALGYTVSGGSSYQLVVPGLPISSAGVLSAWASATTLVLWGQVARTFAT